MAGMLRLNYEWIVNGWYIVKIENLSFKHERWIDKYKSKTPRGAYELGNKYIKRNNQKALDYYSKSCDEKYAKGCTAIGKMYLSGIGVSKDMKISLKYFEKACNFGDIEVCDHVAILYKQGKVIERNYKLAFKYFNKHCYENKIVTAGASCKDAEQIFNKIIPANKKEAFEFLKEECKKNNPIGCYKLASAYSGFLKDLTKPNKELEEKYYKKSCELGYGNACSFITYNDKTIQEKMYKESCKKGGAFSCADMEDIYLEEKKYKEIVDLYKDACDNSRPYWWACSRLGDIYSEGDIIKKDIKKAKYYYKKTCDFGDDYCGDKAKKFLNL